jgi:hypothetical protein
MAWTALPAHEPAHERHGRAAATQPVAPAEPPMNEVELIRTQLATERRHATLVASACVLALEESAGALETLDLTCFCQTCVEYLVWVLTRFEARDRMILEGGSGAELAGILGGREALSSLIYRLEYPSPEGPQGSWRDFAAYFSVDWSARREAADEIFGRTATLADWRSMAGIDASSILDERNRFARVQAAAPPGIQLRPAGARG